MFALKDWLAVVGLLLAVLGASRGLNQWKADKSIRLMEEGVNPELRAARKNARDFIRACPEGCDWNALIKEKYEANPEAMFEMLGPLVSYYNKLGVLLKMGVLADDLILSDVAANVVIFAPLLRAWVEFVRDRRARDLSATKQRSLNKKYGRGVLYLIKRCGAMR